MKTKIFGFALILSLMVAPVYAQEEELLIEEEPTSNDSGEEDLFGDDFFSDLDSFLEEEGGEEGMEAIPPSEPDVIMNEEPDPLMEETGLTEELQGSAMEQSSESSASTSLPTSAQVTLSVTNTSQDNADATQSGARPGDVLRYEIMLNSPTEDVVNYVPTIDVSGIESVVEFTNTGFGVRENGQIVYPSYSHQAPCTQAFTFFVRVNEDCGSMSAMPVSSTEAGSVSVPLNCGLAQTGPSQAFYFLAGLMMLVLTLIFTVFGRSRSS